MEEDLVNDIEIGRQHQHPSFTPGLDNGTPKIINKINRGDQIIQDQSRQRNHRACDCFIVYSTYILTLTTISSQINIKQPHILNIENHSFPGILIKMVFICLWNKIVSYIINQINPKVYPSVSDELRWVGGI